MNAKTCHSVKDAIKFLEKVAKKLKSDDEAILFDGVIEGKSPRFEKRSLFLDLSRHFFGKESVLKLIRLMEPLEFNQLHLRLSDDEGWRIEIPGIPELTDIGANRCHDPSGKRLPDFSLNSHAVGIAVPWPYSFKIDFVRNSISESAA